MKSKLEFITHGAEVRRYHTVNTLVTETVGHHSHGVALICLILGPQASRELLCAALLHDMAEQHVGDIPSPAKRTLGFADKLDDLEHGLIHGGFGWVPVLTEDEKRTLKLADIAQGALKCAREVQMGNSCMRTVFDRYMDYAQDIGLQTISEQELFNAIGGMVK